MKVRRLLVRALEPLCTATHPVVLHRPWLWWFPHCPLVGLAVRLDGRWGTGVWSRLPECEEGVE